MAFRNYHGSDRSSTARLAMTGGGQAVKRLGQPVGAGEQGPAGPAGPAGQDGEDGIDGTNGVDGMGTITIGTTTTLPAGSQATVDNVGTPQDAILNFGIPQGMDGQGGGYGVEEAPYDGQVYGRSNGGWTPVTGGGGGGTCECPPPDLTGYIQDAPQDGYPYVRVNGSWVQLSNYVMTNG